MNMYSLSTNTDFARWTSFNFKFTLFFFVLAFLPFAQSYGQSPFCSGATELCPAEGVTYPATTDAGDAPSGNNYGCLGSEPNPAWFYVEISQAGNINIALTNSNNEDIDFAMWGPFASLPTALSNCGSLNAPIDCSYSTSASETANIPNSSVGQVYLLMITNYSNDPTEINGIGTGSGVATCDGICSADGGSLDQIDLSGCVGASDLNTTITPNYPSSTSEPSSFSYGYTFLVSNAAGVIMFTSDGPDLSSLPPGDFTICGLSYKLSDAAFVATAIGQTVSSLQSSFDNETSLFCGDTSDDCFDVSIGLPSPPIFRDTIGCLGDFIELPNGESYPVPGVHTYSADIGTGCGQDITYVVAPIIPTTEVIDETVCEGECINIDDIDYCDPTQVIMLETEEGCDSLIVLNITFIAVNSEIADPDILSCTNQTVTLDGSASNGNEFEWRDEANNLLGTTTTLDVTSIGCYTLTAINNTVSPSCSAESTVCVTQDGGSTVTTPTPTGTTPVCAPNSGTYSITPETDVDYTWTISGNGSIETGQGTDEITVDWTSAGAANVCVTASNSCGAGTQECFPVTINEVPEDPTIIGDTPICPTGTGSYSVALDATVTSYSWTVPAGASITSGNNTESITVSFGNTAGDVCVIASNACGDATQDCFPVALFDLPADANVSGPMDICPGQTVTYSTPSDVNTTMYNWTIPACATIDSGQGSNSITVTWGATCTAAGNICVDVSNTCGTGQGDCFPVSLSTVTETPMVSTTAASACACDITMASVTDTATATNIVWSVPTGATITGGQGTANITIDWCDAQSGDICAELTYACGTVEDCSPVTISPIPTANAGTDNAICGLTYDLNATASVGSGTWSYSGTGTADFINASTAQTAVTVGDFGSYTFTWTENNNSCTDTDEVTIDFNASPMIDGGITETCNGTNTAYIISFTATGGALPYSTAGITGTWVGDTFTSNEITSGDTYTFTISDANTCISQEYNGIFTCDCETDAGTMLVGQLEACIDQTVTATHNGDETLDANDISQFILHNGDPISGVIFAANNTGEFGLIAPMITETTYFISFAVGDNDGTGNVDLNASCAGFTEGVPVIFHDYPAPIAGADDATCGLTYDLSVMPDAAGGSWSQTGGTGAATFADVNAPNTNVTVSETGIYTFTWSENNSGCLGSDDVEITFNPSPEITGGINEVCNGTNTAYTITFEATGGTLPYTTSGIAGTWTGSTFTSNEITSGDTYTFTITDANGCISQEYNGIFTCDCETDAGTIQVEQLEACIDQTVTATHNGDETLDANDISQFILHNGDPIGGVIFAVSSTGEFGLIAPMITETTYFISFAVGDNDGTGNVDLNAACAGFTEGVPVTFHDYPAPVAGADDATCGLTYNISVTSDVTGGSWSQTGGTGTAAFTDVNAQITTVTVSETGTYIFTWSENNGGCLGSDEIEITFNPSPEITGGINEVCNGTNTAYTITFEATGGTLPYVATGIEGTWVGAVFTCDEIPSGDSYIFSITDANGCISQEYNGIFTCDCETDAGTIQVEQLEACIDQTVTATHNGDETLDANDISQFILHDGNPIDGVIFAANNTGEFGLITPMIAETTYFISFAVGDSDGMDNVDLNAACSNFTESIPVIFHNYPTPTAGTNDVICGLTYSLSATPDVTGGSWSQTGGTGTAIFDDASAANTSVTVSEIGDYVFTWTEDNSGCVGSDIVSISFNESPTVESLIDEICNNTNTAYTVSFTVTGGMAPYSITGIAGTWEENVFTSADLVSGANYSFSIEDANTCVSQEYNGSHICNCETNAGTMSLEQLEACVDQSVTAIHNNDETLDGDDVSQYLLHDGDAVNGQIFDMNTTGVFSLVSPMLTETTYFISLAVGNDDGNGNVDLTANCTDIAQGQPVTFYAYPTPEAGANDDICALTYDLSATPGFSGGMWSSTDATIVFTDAADANTSVTVTTFGTYDFVWTESNNDCEGSDEVTITFNAPPELAAPQMETCDLATNDYTVTFSITGGLAPYFVDGIMIAGTDFTSSSIDSNVPYSFEVTDTNGCGPITITGVRNCDCQSDAGTMEQALQEACIDETVTGLPLGDEVNDGDDVVQYILHDGNGTIAGTIFETSNTPTFGLTSQMTTGVTYYISTIIGNDLGGGIVDMNDPCFRVAVGTPVIFNPLPDGSISGSAAICEGSSTDISFDLTGTAPFSVVFDGVTLTNQSATFTQTVSPLATTDYTLTEVTDANGCVQAVNSLVTITVNTPPSATIAAAANVCNSSDNGNATSLNFSDFITAGDATGTWQDTDASGAIGVFTSLDFTGITPGDYTFIYTTGAANAPCTNVSYTMTVIVEDCVCPSVATSAPDALCNDGGNLDLTSLQVTDQAGTWAIISQPDGASELLSGDIFATTGIPAGDYIFEFTLSNMPPDGCPTTSQETLTVNQAVSAGTPNANLNFCATDATNVNLNDEILDANIGGVWTEVSTNPSMGNAFNANTGVFNPNNQSVGTYTFRYTVTGAAPCGDDFSEISVTISPAPTADAGESDEITCEKQEIILGGNATQGDNISYLWEATNGGILNPDEITSLNPSTLTGGTYILTVTNDLTGCSDTDDVVIAEAVELPMPFFSISDISCFGESDGLITIDSVAGGQPPYVYSLDGENFNTSTFFPSLSGGDYTISVQDVNGCLNDISFEFPEPNEVSVELFAVLEDDNTIRFGDSVALNIIPSVDFDSLESVVWTPSAILSCDTCQMTWAMPFETTNFSVTIEDDGCVATDNFTLVVKRDAPIFVPTAFSPNNNGSNEVLMIFAGDQVAKVNEFLVFNRWGEAVHEYYQFLPNDPAFGWDGTWRGEPMNSAVFTWYAEIELIDGRTEVVKGDVTLMR